MVRGRAGGHSRQADTPHACTHALEEGVDIVVVQLQVLLNSCEACRGIMALRTALGDDGLAALPPVARGSPTGPSRGSPLMKMSSITSWG